MVEAIIEAVRYINEFIFCKSFYSCLGYDRRNAGGSRGGNSFNSDPRPSRFSNKRSRSRSPPARPSRFDNNSYGSDYKRARTDNAGPSHVSLYHIFGSLISI